MAYNRAILDIPAGNALDDGNTSAQHVRCTTVTASRSGETLTVNVSNGTEGWELTFAPRDGQDLLVGTYSDCRAQATHAYPQMTLAGDSGTASGLSVLEGYGHFEVRYIDGSSGVINACAIVFSFRPADPDEEEITGWVAYEMPTGPLDPVDASEFTALTPTRIYDTRVTLNATALSPGEQRSIAVTDIGGVPDNHVTGIVLNVTLITPTEGGFFTAFPSGQPRPTVYDALYAADVTKACLIVCKVGDGGKVAFYTSAGITHMAVDVLGYFTNDYLQTGFTMTAQAPDRVYDSRDTPGTPAAAASTTTITVAGAGDHAAVFNLTTEDPAAEGYFTVYPADGTLPLVSNLNYRPADTNCNLVFCKVDSSGQVKVFTSAEAHIIVDVVGIFATDHTGPGRFVPIAPSTLYDTRQKVGTEIGESETRELEIWRLVDLLPFEFQATQVTMVAANTTEASFFTAWPGYETQPDASNLNWAAEENESNAAVLPTGDDGLGDFINAFGTAELALNYRGYWTA